MIIMLSIFILFTFRLAHPQTIMKLVLDLGFLCKSLSSDQLKTSDQLNAFQIYGFAKNTEISKFQRFQYEHFKKKTPCKELYLPYINNKFLSLLGHFKNPNFKNLCLKARFTSPAQNPQTPAETTMNQRYCVLGLLCLV